MCEQILVTITGINQIITCFAKPQNVLFTIQTFQNVHNQYDKSIIIKYKTDFK